MKSYEATVLAGADRVLREGVEVLDRGSASADTRLAVLETVSALIGGWSLRHYQSEFGTAQESNAPIAGIADIVLREIEASGIPPSLALSALSREVLPVTEQRRSGAYYTDWRLAVHLASRSTYRARRDRPWIDPAAGTGMLLVAAGASIAAGAERDKVIGDVLVACDLSERALRGARLSVASLTSDLGAVRQFNSRLRVQDSLTDAAGWASVAPDGAGLVIANPPWEKLRITKHEAALAAGVTRSYGSGFDAPIDVNTPRAELVRYVTEVVSGTRLQGSGEHDMYKLFLELGMGLLDDGGVLAMLLPAGLIRAQGTEGLRNELQSRSTFLSIDVIENRARNFAIDTRFKFLSVTAVMGKPGSDIHLSVADRTGLLPEIPVVIDRSMLRSVRPDFSIPEVASTNGWQLFYRLATTGVTLADKESPWSANYLREIDMTNDRSRFVRATESASGVPVLEGRHVAQYRSRAKQYLGGEGRAASWRPVPLTLAAEVIPQWRIDESHLRPAARQRHTRSRIGFCDITGQTNERSLLAARIPAGVVCGNKVPTLAFSSDDSDREDLFLAMANSFVVDWLLRRLLTTTVNFFLLDSLPLPPLAPQDKHSPRIIELVRLVTRAEGDPRVGLATVARWRAEIDALIAHAWGITLAEMTMILEDFPLLDRHQPPLPGEKRSTITADAVLSALASINEEHDPWARRLAAAAQQGATPYVPAEHARGI